MQAPGGAGPTARDAVLLHPVRYEPLGFWSGGMGRVHLCRDREADRYVAVKTVSPDRAGDARSRRRFLEEAANWIFLGRHPNVVQAFRVDQWGDPPRPCLVLEYVGDGDLRADASLGARLRRGRPLPFGRALRIGLDVARGMRYASTRIPGLVHRDLKPGNILIDADWRARVTDFGIARSFRGIDPARWARALAGRNAATTQAIGTPRYRAPEQWSSANLLDERADIYSFGCILFEMLTCSPAAPGRDIETLQRQHCAGTLSAVPGALPPVVRRLIRSLTRLKPHDRPPHWGAVEESVAAAYETVTGRKVPDPGAASAVDGELPADRLDAAPSYVSIGSSYLDLGQLDLARLFLRRALSISEEVSSEQMIIEASRLLALATSELGDLPGALSLLDRCISVAQKHRDTASVAEALSLKGLLHQRLGRADRAAKALHRAVDAAEESGDRRVHRIALGNLGNFYAQDDRPRAAIEVFQRLLADVRSPPDRVIEGQCLANLGAARLAAGDERGAAEALKQALTLARELDDLLGQCTAGRLLSDAYDALQRPRLAAEAYERYLEALTQGGGIDEQIEACKKAADRRERLGHHRIARRHADNAAHLAAVYLSDEAV